MPDPQNTLYYGDNLDILRRYIKDESVDLVYLDPPFNSNADYNVLFAEHSTTGGGKKPHAPSGPTGRPSKARGARRTRAPFTYHVQGGRIRRVEVAP